MGHSRSNCLKLTRRAALFGPILLALGCATAPTKPEPVRVLFVCRFGSVKSAVAREQFQRIITATGLNAQASSRAITPEDHVSPGLGALLAAEGLDLGRQPLQALAARDLESSDIIVAFDRLPAEFGATPTRDWSDLPSMNANYPAARKILMARLTALATEISQPVSPPATSR